MVVINPIYVNKSKPMTNLWRFWKKFVKLTTECNDCHQYSYMEWKHGNEMKNHHCVLTVRRVMTNIWKSTMLIIIVNSAFIDLPSPSNIITKFLFALYLFTFVNEIRTDLFLAIHYTWNTSHMYQYVNNRGLFVTYMEMEVPCSLFIYSCSKKPAVQILHVIGIINIAVYLLAIAFIGYLLQWG